MTRMARCVTAALLVTAITACGDSDPVESRTAPSTSSDPLTTAELRFVEKLAEIAPPLAEHPERAARRAANSCADLARDDVSGEFQVSNAVRRFSGGTYTVTEGQARQILEAARTTVCAES